MLKTERDIPIFLIVLFAIFGTIILFLLAVEVTQDYNSDNAKTLNSLEWQINRDINFIRIEKAPEQDNQRYVTVAFQDQGQL